MISDSFSATLISVSDQAIKIFRYSFQVCENALDTFGHVNNAQFLRYLEEARWDLMNLSGFSLQKIHQQQTGPVVLQVTIRFRRELKARDRCVILSQAKGIDRRGIADVQQDIRSEDLKTLHAEATLKIGYFDMKLRKLILPPEDWLKTLGFPSSAKEGHA